MSDAADYGVEVEKLMETQASLRAEIERLRADGKRMADRFALVEAEIKRAASAIEENERLRAEARLCPKCKRPDETLHCTWDCDL